MADTDLDALREHLIPFSFHFSPELPSTSDRAVEMLRRRELSPPAIVMAGRQTQGRGTRGRTWHSGQQCFTATFALPIHPDRPIHHLPLLAGLAVRDAVVAVVPEALVTIKWPNDLLLEDRKVGGLLCERKEGADLVGVGINLAPEADALPPGLHEAIGSLAEVDRFALLESVVRQFRENLLAANAPTLAQRLNVLRDALAWMGAPVVVQRDQDVQRGILAGVDHEGRLCLGDEAGTIQRVVSGTLRRA